MNKKWKDVQLEQVPFEKPVFVTDGKNVAVTILKKFQDTFQKGVYVLSFGFSGFEWDYNVFPEAITHWYPIDEELLEGLKYD
jgi:hypothetical protein